MLLHPSASTFKELAHFFHFWNFLVAEIKDNFQSACQGAI